VKLLHNKLNIELSPATIVHVNKHNRPGIFTTDPQHANVVFKLKASDKILPLEVHNMKLPLYTTQEVEIISANQFIIGYVDIKSEEYYYLTNDFYKAAGIGFIDIVSWLTGILVVGGMLTIIKNEYAALFAFVLLFAIWILNLTLKTIVNRKIENNMDELLKTYSVL